MFAERLEKPVRRALRSSLEDEESSLASVLPSARDLIPFAFNIVDIVRSLDGPQATFAREAA